MMYSDLMAPHLQAFFADYLTQQRRLSPQTIASCRDTFRLLLTFLRDQTGVEPSALRIADRPFLHKAPKRYIPRCEEIRPTV